MLHAWSRQSSKKKKKSSHQNHGRRTKTLHARAAPFKCEGLRKSESSKGHVLMKFTLNNWDQHFIEISRGCSVLNTMWYYNIRCHLHMWGPAHMLKDFSQRWPFDARNPFSVWKMYVVVRSILKQPKSYTFNVGPWIQCSIFQPVLLVVLQCQAAHVK